MHKRPRIDPALGIGTALSIGLSVLFFIKPDTATALAVVGGMCGITITLTIQLLLREARETEVSTRQARLFSRIEGIDWLCSWIDEGSAIITDVAKKYADTPAESEVKRLLDDTLARLRGLHRGQVLIDFDDIALIIDRTDRVKKTLRAVSVQTIDIAWWLSPQSRRYWEGHLNAMRRGVTIERIFIYDSWPPHLAELAHKQKDAGVHVFKVDRSALSVELRKDIIIWDHDCAYESRLVGDGSAAQNFFMIDQYEIQALQKVYSRVRDLATPL